MKNISAYLVQTLIGLGVVAGHWFGIDELGNITIALIWFIAIINFISLVIPGDDFFKDEGHKRRLILRVIFAINILIIFAAGWFFTGITYLIAWLALWGKRRLWEEKTC